MELFDTYEIHTPERRDLRDPLLIGRCGSEHYRVALWGESLRPLAEMTALVQESLVRRKRAAHWQGLIIGAGTLLGFALGWWWLGQQPTFGGNEAGAGALLAWVGLCCTGFLTQVYTPETHQQRFLDRYC
jgi:hypothetical protein